MTRPEPSREESSPACGATPKSSQPSGADASPERVHDFARKLQQPGLWPGVADYVRYQRARRQSGGGEAEMADRAPLSINLDLTTACNYACDHCIDWEILNSKVRHDDTRLRESLRAMVRRGLRSVILIGGGEPTLYPGFAGMVEFLKELGLQVAVVSNGSRNDRVLQAAPFFTKGDWVRLSLDAGSNDVFRRMHNPSRASLTLDEICSWIPRIKSSNPDLTLGYSFVITWRGGSRGEVKVIENIGEMVEAAARAEAAGFDYISFKPFLERQDDGAEVMDPKKSADELRAVTARISRSLDEARAAAGDEFRVLASTNLRVLMAGNWRDYTSQPRTCHMQMMRQVVTPLGTFNCPAHRGVEKARIGDGALWSDPSAGRAETRRLLDTFDAAKECSEVTCLYHGTNWWLEEMISGDAPLPDEAPVEESGDWFL